MPSNCKYIKQKYKYTPNDYKLEFDYSSIPRNIQWEGSIDLENTLNKTSPLSKQIHIQMNTSNNSTLNGYRIKTYVQWRDIE